MRIYMHMPVCVYTSRLLLSYLYLRSFNSRLCVIGEKQRTIHYFFYNFFLLCFSFLTSFNTYLGKISWQYDYIISKFDYNHKNKSAMINHKGIKIITLNMSLLLNVCIKIWNRILKLPLHFSILIFMSLTPENSILNIFFLF